MVIKSLEIFNSLHVPVIQVDLDLRIVHANRWACKISGKSTDELSGLKCCEIWSQEYTSGNRPDSPSLREGKVLKWEWAGPDGNRWHVSSFPVSDQKGMFTGAILIFEKAEDTDQDKTGLSFCNEHLKKLLGEKPDPQKHSEQFSMFERDTLISILEVLDDGVYIANRNYDILFANAALRKDFGGYEGRKCFEFFNDRGESCPWCRNEEIFKGNTLKYDWYSEKSKKTYEVIETPFLHADGSISSVQILRDITEQQHAKVELENTRDSLAKAQEIAHVGSYELDLEEGIFKSLSEESRKILGLNPLQDTLSMDFFVSSIIHPKDREYVKTAGDKAIAACTPVSMDYRIVRPDGITRWIHGEGKTECDNNGKARRIVGILQDITDRKSIELALTESEGRFRGITENTTDLTVIVNEKRVFTYANPAVRIILDFSPDEVIGESIDRFLHPDDLPKALKVIEESIKYPGITQQFAEFRARHRDGRWVYLEALVTSLPDMPGINGIVVNCRNISERKLAEDELRKKNEELEAALKYNKELTSMVAHDLRSPLVPVVGYADLLLNGALCEIPEEAIEPLRAIQRSANLLSTLTDDFLMISRMGQGKMKLFIESLDVSDHVQKIIQDFQGIGQEKPFSIRWSGERFRVLADQTRFQQVIRNLIDNAIKYSRDSVNITITTEINGLSGMIRVTDDGIGISEEHFPLIFQPFYRISSVESRGTKGSGLGLAIVRDLLNLMDGSISIESKKGEWTTFTIMLPLAET